jgi:hypothetical protein
LSPAMTATEPAANPHTDASVKYSRRNRLCLDLVDRRRAMGCWALHRISAELADGTEADCPDGFDATSRFTGAPRSQFYVWRIVTIADMLNEC